MYGTVCFLFEWYHHEANFERFASSLESKPNPNEWNKLTAAAGATDTKETKGATTMAACLSRRANAGFFISLSWFGLPGARCCRTALPCRPAHAHVCQLLCLSCRDRWWLPPRQAIRPQITPMFTAAEHHQHSATLLWIYFFPRLMPCPLFPLFLFCFCDGTRHTACDAHPAKYLYQ